MRDSVNRGYMYWNNIGRYDDISPDVGDTAYTGPALEAQKEFRKPALGDSNLLYPKNVNTAPVSTPAQGTSEKSAMDTKSQSIFPSISDIRKLWQAYEYDKREI